MIVERGRISVRNLGESKLHTPLDPFDPNNWELTEHEHRIYGDDHAQTWGLVDDEDYQWAIQWRWCWLTHKAGGMYLRRAVCIYENKIRTTTTTLYLHVEIQKRKGIYPPGPEYVKVDHRNGVTTDNRRKNLRWATQSMNAKNVRGAYSHDFIEDISQ